MQMNTAQALLTLDFQGHSASHQGFLYEVEVEAHFRAYERESKPHFIADCNIPIALLSEPNPSMLAPQISEASTFLSR